MSGGASDRLPWPKAYWVAVLALCAGIVGAIAGGVRYAQATPAEYGRFPAGDGIVISPGAGQRAGLQVFAGIEGSALRPADLRDAVLSCRRHPDGQPQPVQVDVLRTEWRDGARQWVRIGVVAAFGDRTRIAVDLPNLRGARAVTCVVRSGGGGWWIGLLAAGGAPLVWCWLFAAAAWWWGRNRSPRVRMASLGGDAP